MPITEWDDSLSLGVPELDSQHQILISHINELYDAADHDDRNIVACRMIEELHHYAVEHFTLEEHYMTRFNVPDSERHRAEHQFFADKVIHLDVACLTTAVAYTDLMDFLMGWLINHIRGTDLAMRSSLNT